MKDSFRHIHAERAAFDERHWQALTPMLEARYQRRRKRRLLLWLLWGVGAVGLTLMGVYFILSADHPRATTHNRSEPTAAHLSPAVLSNKPRLSAPTLPDQENSATLSDASVLSSMNPATASSVPRAHPTQQPIVHERLASSDVAASNAFELSTTHGEGVSAIGRSDFQASSMDPTYGDVKSTRQDRRAYSPSSAQTVTSSSSGRDELAAVYTDEHRSMLASPEIATRTLDPIVYFSPSRLSLSSVHPDEVTIKDHNHRMVEIAVLGGWRQVFGDDIYQGPDLGAQLRLPILNDRWSLDVTTSAQYLSGDFIKSQDREIGRVNTLVANIISHSSQAKNLYCGQLAFGISRHLGALTIGAQGSIGYLFAMTGYRARNGYSVPVSEYEFTENIREILNNEQNIVTSATSYESLALDHVDRWYIGAGIQVSYNLGHRLAIGLTGEWLPTGIGRFRDEEVLADSEYLIGSSPNYSATMRLIYRL